MKAMHRLDTKCKEIAQALASAGTERAYPLPLAMVSSKFKIDTGLVQIHCGGLISRVPSRRLVFVCLPFMRFQSGPISYFYRFILTFFVSFLPFYDRNMTRGLFFCHRITCKGTKNTGKTTEGKRGTAFTHLPTGNF